MGNAGRLHGNIAGKVAELFLRRHFQGNTRIITGRKRPFIHGLIQGFRNSLLQ